MDTRVHFTEREMLSWDIYFGNLVAMQMHPGNRHELNLTVLAALADDMINVRRSRCQQSGEQE